MKSLNLKTFKTLQHSITCILHINSSNKTFCSIHDFTFLVTDTKIKGQVFWVSRKKETFASVIFSKICYVVCTINCAGKLICLCACLHEHNCTGLTDKLELPDLSCLRKIEWWKTKIFTQLPNQIMQFFKPWEIFLFWTWRFLIILFCKP